MWFTAAGVFFKYVVSSSLLWLLSLLSLSLLLLLLLLLLLSLLLLLLHFKDSEGDGKAAPHLQRIEDRLGRLAGSAKDDRG